MLDDFLVSVVIPVYNAKKYLEESIKSVVDQDFVGEVIVIEDGNRDGTLELCYSFQKQYSKVKVYTHLNNENLGASASRNLGIEKSKFTYISFLDADDIYLENRFHLTRKIFAENKNAKVIYEPVGVFFTSDKAKQDFCNWKGIHLSETEDYITYNMKESFGNQFLNDLLRFGGYPHLNGITLNKNIFKKVDLFNPKLRLHQDTDLIIRLANTGACFPGDKNVIVASRRFHAENRIPKLNFNSRKIQMEEIYNWAHAATISHENFKLIQKMYWSAKVRAFFQSNNVFVRLINSLIIRFL